MDLKRPGRVDVKIPIFPTATPEEGYQPPVPLTVIYDQIALAVAEATDLGFVPEHFRK